MEYMHTNYLPTASDDEVEKLAALYPSGMWLTIG